MQITTEHLNKNNRFKHLPIQKHKSSAEALVENIKADFGYVFTSFDLHMRNSGLAADIEWNYKDSLHHNWVHEDAIQQINYIIEPEQQSSLWNLSVFGIRVPMVIQNYQPEPNTQIAVSTLFNFILIIKNHWQDEGENQSIVTTSYFIGSSPLFRFAHPLIRWSLARNYRRLMSSDVPVRNRRAELRGWGFRFRNESHGHFTYKTSDDLLNDYVECPNHDIPSSLEVDVSSFSSELILGKSDQWGLRLLKRDRLLFVYGRLCMHEGACLDKPRRLDHRSLCPWHGRKIFPIARFDLISPSEQAVQARFHHLQLRGRILRVDFRLSN